MHSIRSSRDLSDTKELVLQAAMSMLEADRGLLLGAPRRRRRRQPRRHLRPRLATGDPESDPFVQRIGERSLERDETVREVRLGRHARLHRRRVRRGAGLRHATSGDFDDFDDEVLLALGDHAGAVLGNARLQGDLRSRLHRHRARARRRDRGQGPCRAHPLRGGRALRGRRRRAARPRRRAARGAALRLAAARRRQDRHLRAHPAQAGPPDPGRVRRRQAAPRASGTGSSTASPRWPASPRRSCTTTSASTARGYPAGPRRRGHPARGAHHRGRRLLQRDDRRPPVQPRAARPRRRAPSSSAARGPSSTREVVELFVERGPREPPPTDAARCRAAALRAVPSPSARRRRPGASSCRAAPSASSASTSRPAPARGRGRDARARRPPRAASRAGSRSPARAARPGARGPASEHLAEQILPDGCRVAGATWDRGETVAALIERARSRRTREGEAARPAPAAGSRPGSRTPATRAAAGAPAAAPDGGRRP